MAGTVGEGTTQGLDDLNARCAQYKKVLKTYYIRHIFFYFSYLHYR